MMIHFYFGASKCLSMLVMCMLRVCHSAPFKKNTLLIIMVQLARYLIVVSPTYQLKALVFDDLEMRLNILHIAPLMLLVIPGFQ